MTRYAIFTSPYCYVCRFVCGQPRYTGKSDEAMLWTSPSEAREIATFLGFTLGTDAAIVEVER
jgi:hypothetical protein